MLDTEICVELTMQGLYKIILSFKLPKMKFRLHSYSIQTSAREKKFFILRTIHNFASSYASHSHQYARYVH